MRTQSPVTAVCVHCGKTAECSEEGLPQGWSIGSQAGRIDRICPHCARANIRAIEGKLPEEYWES